MCVVFPAAARSLATVPEAKVLVLLLVVRGGERHINRAKQGEDHGLQQSDEEFEALLLEVLSDYQVTVPEIGTIAAQPGWVL